MRKTIFSFCAGFLLFLWGLAGTAGANVVDLYGNINDLNTVNYQYFSLAASTSVNVSLETFEGEFDPVMYLFYNDGSLSVDDYITYDDDGGTPATYWYNSFINTSLAPGNYMTAVSDFGFSLDEAVSGLNPSINYVDDGSYRLQIRSEEGMVTAGNPVPEPSTVLLFGVGILGIVGIGRKRIMK